MQSITHTITVDAEIPDSGAQGVLVCLGGDTAGWTLYVRDDGKLVYHYDWFDMERYQAVSDRAVGTGPVELTPRNSSRCSSKWTEPGVGGETT